MIIRLLLAFSFLCGSTLEAEAAGKSVHVRGYYRKNGTYVPPYTRSAPRTGAYGLAWSLPPSMPPRNVPVDGYTRANGTYVRPHTRPIAGGKDPEPPPSARGKASLRDSNHRTGYRATARGLSESSKIKKRYPPRQWLGTDGTVLAEGRLKSRAMSKLKIERMDGSVFEVTVEQLGDDDRDWLEAASRNPEKMKTDVMPEKEGASSDDLADDQQVIE